MHYSTANSHDKASANPADLIKQASSGAEFFRQLDRFNYPLFRRDDENYYTFCPMHEASGAHDPSLHITITPERVKSYCFPCGKGFYTKIRDGEIAECTATYQPKPKGSATHGVNSRRACREIKNPDAYLEWCNQVGLEKFGFPYEVAEYFYAGSDFLKVRWSDKEFTWLRRVRDGVYSQGLNGQVDTVPLYGVEKLKPEGTVYVVEGEKDVETLHGLGLQAVSYIYTGRQPKTRFAALAGRDIVALQDNDAAGRGHVKRLVEYGGPYFRSLRIVPPLGAAERYDVTNWVDDGGTVEQLEKLASEVEPEERPDAPEEPASSDVADPWEPISLGTKIERNLDRWGPGGMAYEQASITWVAGEPESGKSVVSYACAIERMKRGEKVLFLDEEAGQADTQDKMLALGATLEMLNKYFVYLGPEDRDVLADVDRLMALVELHRPTLIIFDSATAHIEASGLNDNAGTDVNRYVRVVMRPLVHRYGIAVIVIDHKTKSKDGINGRYGVGSGRKLGVADVAYNLTAKDPFNRFKSGELVQTCTKDKFGSIGRGSAWAITVDVAGGAISLSAEAVVGPEQLIESGLTEVQKKANAVYWMLLRERRPMSKTEIRDRRNPDGKKAIGGHLTAIEKALDYLIGNDKVTSRIDSTQVDSRGRKKQPVEVFEAVKIADPADEVEAGGEVA